MSGTAGEVASGILVRPDQPDYIDAFMFLVAEAELLDSGDLAGWLSLLAPEVDYTVPVQTTRLRENLSEQPATSFHLYEDRASIELRLRRRTESNAVWSENPAPRIRRFVSNVRVRRRAEGGDLQVSSYLLLMRSRSDLDSYELISADRRDVLTRDDSGLLQLRSREITVDQARLGVANLPFPV